MKVSKSVSTIISLPGFPDLKVTASIPAPESQSAADLAIYTREYTIGGVVPVMVEVWEVVPGTSSPDSDLTEYWAWLAYFPGTSLSVRSHSERAAGVMFVSKNGLLGQIDGGPKLDVDHAEFQSEILKFAKSIL